MPNMKRIAYDIRNMFKTKEQIKIESKMKYNNQKREFERYDKELSTNIKRFTKMAEETAKSGNHQNALICARFVKKLQKIQVWTQGLRQRFEMMYAMLQLSNMMGTFAYACGEMGIIMDKNFNLEKMTRNTVAMEQGLGKMDTMMAQINDMFTDIDENLGDPNGEVLTDEELNAEALKFLDDIMGRSNIIDSIPTVQPAAAQPVQQEAAADESSELLSKMLQELKD